MPFSFFKKSAAPKTEPEITDPNAADPEGESSEGKNLTYQDIGNIREQFVRGIELPKTKRSPQILVCTVGIVGSGKTTVMKPLCAKLDLVHIQLNRIRMLLKAGGFNFNETLSIAHGIIGYFLQEGYSVGLDADCVGPMIPLIEEQEKTFHVRVIWVHVNPPEEFILKKFHRPGYGMMFDSTANATALYQSRKPLHEHLDMPFTYVFDPSQPDLAQQLDYAVKTIDGIK